MKFVPGVTQNGRFVPGQIIDTKAGPTFIPGQICYTGIFREIFETQKNIKIFIFLISKFRGTW
jgi:hypothetical protein